MNKCCTWLILLALLTTGNCGCNNFNDCGSTFNNDCGCNNARNSGNNCGNNCCNALWIIFLLLIFGCGNSCNNAFGLNNGCNNCGCN